MLLQKDRTVIAPEINDIKVIESEIENNPLRLVFVVSGLWLKNADRVGTILGPVYLPEFQRVVRSDTGAMDTQIMPDSYVVLKVLDITQNGHLQ